MDATSQGDLESSDQVDHWDAKGWFLGALGASCWFVVSAIALTWRGQLALAGISCSVWIIAMAASICLWRARNCMSVFSARIVFLFVLSLAMPLVWFTSWDRPIDTMPSLDWVRTVSGISAASMFPLIIACLLVGKCYSLVGDGRNRSREQRMPGQ